jgi:hypothetical protein
LINDLINSYNYARNSNFVFAETVSIEQFQNLNISKKYVVEENELQTTYKLDFINIKENDVIFCNLDFVYDLFILLRKVKNISNLKLITHQSDKKIDFRMFSKKPKCIVKWYSINVEYKHEDLIPIPIGIANKFSPKNLQGSDLKMFPFSNKEIKLYINFNKNTNYKKRSSIYKTYKDENWVIIKDPTLSINEYNADLQKNLYILSPWGNGVDTHRFWEALYSGSIPITVPHQTYLSSAGLPVIYLEDLNSITFDMLKNYNELLKNKKFKWEKLKVQYWMSIINESKIDTKEIYNLQFNKFFNSYLNKKFKAKKFIKSKIKKFKYYILRPFRYIMKYSIS